MSEDNDNALSVSKLAPQVELALDKEATVAVAVAVDQSITAEQ